ncbi:unnamed protein product [Peniophora sp. CBMAI 1063]|nr:unnamed protein product [Peniophora sp. CBMAI 1063]
MSTLNVDEGYVVTPTLSGTSTANSDTGATREVKTTVPKDYTLSMMPMMFNFPNGEKFCVPRAGLPAESKRLDDLYARHYVCRINEFHIASIGRSCDMDNDFIADVSAEEFRGLLKLSCRFASEEVDVLTADDWMAVLKLAKLWDMPTTHEKAAKELDSEIDRRTAGEQMILARRYSVEQWFKQGFKMFVTGKEKISDDERKTIGWETYARLLEAKDKAWIAAEKAYENTRKDKRRHFLGISHADHERLFLEAFVGSSWMPE